MSKDSPCTVAKLSVYLDPEESTQRIQHEVDRLRRYVEHYVADYIRTGLRDGPVIIKLDITAEKESDGD